MGAALVCIDSVTSMNFHFFLKNTQSLSLPKIYRALKLFDFGPLSESVSFILEWPYILQKQAVTICRECVPTRNALCLCLPV